MSKYKDMVISLNSEILDIKKHLEDQAKVNEENKNYIKQYEYNTRFFIDFIFIFFGKNNSSSKFKDFLDKCYYFLNNMINSLDIFYNADFNVKKYREFIERVGNNSCNYSNVRESIKKEYRHFFFEEHGHLYEKIKNELINFKWFFSFFLDKEFNLKDLPFYEEFRFEKEKQEMEKRVFYLDNIGDDFRIGKEKLEQYFKDWDAFKSYYIDLKKDIKNPAIKEIVKYLFNHIDNIRISYIKLIYEKQEFEKNY